MQMQGQYSNGKQYPSLTQLVNNEGIYTRQDDIRTQAIMMQLEKMAEAYKSLFECGKDDQEKEETMAKITYMADRVLRFLSRAPDPIYFATYSHDGRFTELPTQRLVRTLLHRMELNEKASQLLDPPVAVHPSCPQPLESQL